MTSPPRAIEAILSALGAESTYRDAVLGDMAEEFSTIAGQDGVAAARWWYYGQAVRSAPHLVRNWMSHASLRDARRIGGAIVTAYVGLFILALILGGVAAGGMHALGIRANVRPTSPGILAAGMILGTLGTVLGGVFCASMDDETPMLSAVAFAVAWATVDTVVLVFGRHETWQTFVPLVPLIGVTLGGMLRMSAGVGKLQGHGGASRLRSG